MSGIITDNIGRDSGLIKSAASAGKTLKITSWWMNDTFDLTTSATEIVTHSLGNCSGTNSIYLLDMSIGMGWNSDSNNDGHNYGIVAWIQDGSSNYYRFGAYKTSVTMSNLSTPGGNYWFDDHDGSMATHSTWNSMRQSYSGIGGNQASEKTNWAASGYAAGTALTFKVNAAATNGYINKSAAGGVSQSFFTITELSGF